MLLAVSIAYAARPSLDLSLDSPEGTVRVWYTHDGEDAVLDTDADANGLPDFAEEVAATAEDVLDVYAAQGFRALVPDGDGILDVFLVDYGGSADGSYIAENCTTTGVARVCSGYFMMENDFVGYRYANLSLAIRVLTSHELFHAVQAAYNSSEDVWFSEGTAAWAEDLYDPGSSDFVSFCDAYLDDTGRSLNEPPAGPVPTFAYATALWWKYLAIQHGDGVLIELMEASETAVGDDILESMAAIEEAQGSSLAADWTTFTRWNLATGRWAGAAESYDFAAQIGPVEAEADGDTLVDDNRFYPLAATYYRLSHPGGELFFATDADAPELVFSLHAISDDGVGEALLEVNGEHAVTSLGEQPAGDYWFLGTNPTLAENSTKVTFCLGDEATMAACVPEDTGDTGDEDLDDDGPGGCGCDTRGGADAAWILAGVGALALRRRARAPAAAGRLVTGSTRR